MAEEKPYMFWIWTLASTIFRLFLIFSPANINLSSRPEVSTPHTSLRRLAEGYWLKQSSLSPYAGSMYHGSPLLLSILGPLTVQRIEGQSSHHLCSDQELCSHADDTNNLLDTVWFLLLQIYLVHCFFELLVRSSRSLIE